MESELPGIIQVKVVTKNMLFGSLGMSFFEEKCKFSESNCYI